MPSSVSLSPLSPCTSRPPPGSAPGVPLGGREKGGEGRGEGGREKGKEGRGGGGRGRKAGKGGEGRREGGREGKRAGEESMQ